MSSTTDMLWMDGLAAASLPAKSRYFSTRLELTRHHRLHLHVEGYGWWARAVRRLTSVDGEW